jgi:hypothetical protein
VQQHFEYQSLLTAADSLRTQKHLPLCSVKRIGPLFLACFLLSDATLGISAEEPLPATCGMQCATPYGDILGRSPRDVPAYSNCSSWCVSQDACKINGTPTGMQWQCVEYARRWLLSTEGLVFESVGIAADIWNDVNYLVDTRSNTRRNLRNFPNGSTELPQRGDLLIWSSSFLGTGHVAVVSRVDHEAAYVEVVEQNFLNQKWPGKYARRIPIQRRKGGIWLEEKFLIGWKRLED